ncbi:DNA helicase [Streptomyces phage Mischief19]|nr:DNA helicase [Streptomyces phage Mischief19]
MSIIDSLTDLGPIETASGSITLRDYQVQAIEGVESAWSQGITRPVVVAATGAGKTSIFCAMVGRYIERLRREGKRILILAHREELLNQAAERIKLQNPGVWVAVVKGSRGQKTHEFADVVVASVQTLARPKRRAAIDRIGMIVVDECHNAASKGYKDVLAHYGAIDAVDGQTVGHDAEAGTPTVGFTATLTRMNGGLPEVWDSVAYNIKIHTLIKRGFLVPPVAKTVEVPGLNLATTRVTGGDLNTGDLAKALEESEAFDAIAEAWQESAATPDGPYPYRPTIVFMPNVATAEQMVNAFTSRGVCADLVTGSMGTEARKAVYDSYNSGKCNVLVNCMVLTEGFDAPLTSCVVIGRPTLNGGLYVQCVGRGLRLAPGKSDCLILDVAGASLKHSLAGVNDLESDCMPNCDCNCLTCGCSDRCKCGLRQCGCKCLENHEGPAKTCRCAGSEECSCGCPGDLDGTGQNACACDINPDCACRGEGEQLKTKEVAVDVIKNLVDVDILGEAVAASHYAWLTTNGGTKFLSVGQDANLFLLPNPADSTTYFQGRIDGSGPRAKVTRLDDGALPADEALRALESHADATGYTYSNRKASWRRTPASEAQRGLLKRLGVEVPEGLRKGDASDLVSVAKTSRTLDGWLAARGYVAKG